MAVEICVKNVDQYTLLGLMSAKFPDTAPKDLEEEINIKVYQFSEEIDLFEEVNCLALKYPKAKLTLRRDGTRELWGMKGGRPKKTVAADTEE